MDIVFPFVGFDVGPISQQLAHLFGFCRVLSEQTAFARSKIGSYSVLLVCGESLMLDWRSYNAGVLFCNLLFGNRFRGVFRFILDLASQRFNGSLGLFKSDRGRTAVLLIKFVCSG